MENTKLTIAELQMAYGHNSIHADINGWMHFGRYAPSDFGYSSDDVELLNEGFAWRPKSFSQSQTPTSKDNLQVEAQTVESVEQCRCGEFKPTCPTHGNSATPTPQVESVEEAAELPARKSAISILRVFAKKNYSFNQYDEGDIVEAMETYAAQFQQSQPNTSALEGEWIDVNERLPELGEAVLILTDYGKMATAFTNDHSKPTWGWTDYMRMQHGYGSVTHWMPLPNPPTK